MLARALNLFFPPQCPACDALVSTHGALCPECWRGIGFISDPACMTCGLPFAYELGPDAQCAECLKSPPPFVSARAVMRYGDVSKALIIKLKFHDQTFLSRIYGPWLMNAGRAQVTQADMIVPVPLHYRRYLSRRYNQAALIAGTLAQLSGQPMLPDALLRIKATKRQSELARKERQQNVAKAFAANPRHAKNLQGRRILLVDDVYTTGATLSECARTLLAAGAREVYVVTLARACGE